MTIYRPTVAQEMGGDHSINKAMLDLKKAKELHQEIKNYSKKEMDIFIRTVTLLAYSRITPEAASNEFKKNNLIPLLLLLPTDPHQRLSILHLLKKV